MTDGYTRYFENHGIIGEHELNVLAHLRNRTDRAILEILLQSPAGMLGITGPSVSWHIRRLAADGIVLIDRKGRSVTYAINADAAVLVRKHLTG